MGRLVIRDLLTSLVIVRSTQQHWSLMPLHGMLSCVRPASLCYGSGGVANFPAYVSSLISVFNLARPRPLTRVSILKSSRWFPKNSSQGKLGRLLGEIQIRMRLKVSGDRREIRQSYIPTLFPRLVEPLQQRGTVSLAPPLLGTR